MSLGLATKPIIVDNIKSAALSQFDLAIFARHKGEDVSFQIGLIRVGEKLPDGLDVRSEVRQQVFRLLGKFVKRSYHCLLSARTLAIGSFPKDHNTYSINGVSTSRGTGLSAHPDKS